MRPTTEQPVWLQVRPSRGLLVFILLSHLAAFMALLIVQLPGVTRWLVALLVLLSLIRELRIHGLQRGNRSVRRLHWRSDGRWWLTDGKGRVSVYPEHELWLCRPWLVVLRLEAAADKRWLWLPGDCADADTLRRLRVRLGRQLPAEDQAKPLRGT